MNYENTPWKYIVIFEKSYDNVSRVQITHFCSLRLSFSVLVVSVFTYTNYQNIFGYLCKCRYLPF